MTLLEKEGCTRWSPEVRANSNYSVILWLILATSLSLQFLGLSPHLVIQNNLANSYSVKLEAKLFTQWNTIHFLTYLFKKVWTFPKILNESNTCYEKWVPFGKGRNKHDQAHASAKDQTPLKVSDSPSTFYVTTFDSTYMRTSFLSIETL